MSIFRSERMRLCQIKVPRENAWHFLNELGDLSCLQFIDQTPEEPAYSRAYSHNVKLCEELTYKLTLIEAEMARFAVPISRCEDPHRFLEGIRTILSSRAKAETTYLNELETDIEERLAYVTEQVKQFDDSKNKYIYYLEYAEVLKKVREIFSESNLFRFFGLVIRRYIRFFIIFY